MITAPGIYEMTAEEYHSLILPTPALSASIIKILVDQSCLHAWHAHPALNPNWAEQQDDKEEKFDIGTAAHALILEGIDKIVEIDAPDWRKKETKELRDLAYAEGKIPLLKKHASDVRNMVNQAHKSIAECSNLCGVTLADGRPEMTLIWEEDGIWCKARTDWLHNDNELIIDLKSTQGSADPYTATRRVMDQMMGDVQEAWYKRGLQKITGKDAAFIFLVQESKAPYACSFIEPSATYLEIGKNKVEVAMGMWRQCLETGTFPGYSNQFFRPDPKNWVMQSWYDRVNDLSQGEENAD
jgi:hypothetical protein